MQMHTNLLIIKFLIYLCMIDEKSKEAKDKLLLKSEISIALLVEIRPFPERK